MNVVKFETAKALKQAGFPQPKPMAGQVWYDAGDCKYILLDNPEGPYGGNIASVWMVPHDFQLTDTTSIFLKDHCVFAPTATDILPHLWGCLIGFDEEKFVIVTPLMWEEGEDGEAYYSGGDTLSKHTNPAEAGADLWLKTKKKEWMQTNKPA